MEKEEEEEADAEVAGGQPTEEGGGIIARMTRQWIPTRPPSQQGRRGGRGGGRSGRWRRRAGDQGSRACVDFGHRCGR